MEHETITTTVLDLNAVAQQIADLALEKFLQMLSEKGIELPKDGIKIQVPPVGE